MGSSHFKEKVQCLCLADGSLLRMESPLVKNPITRRGQYKRTKTGKDSHLWTQNKLTTMTIQIMGCSIPFCTFITVTFDWDSPMKNKRAFKELAREIKRLSNKYNGKVFYGVLEGIFPSNPSIVQKPPHYHILMDVCLSVEDQKKLDQKIKMLGFCSFDYREDVSEGADLKFRKYICKRIKHGRCEKPSIFPYKWKGIRIPTTFKSANFLKYKLTEVVEVEIQTMLDKSIRQPYFRRQFLTDENKDESFKEEPSTVTQNKDVENIGYELKHLKLKLVVILLVIFLLFSSRFSELLTVRKSIPQSLNIENIHYSPSHPKARSPPVVE